MSTAAAILPVATLALSARWWRPAQALRLRRTVRRAMRSPFWRARFEAAGVDPASIRRAEDLARLPVLTRADLQAAPLRDRIPDGYDPDAMLPFTTSGSTGQPLDIRKLPGDQAVNDALMLRALWRYGFRPGQRKMNMQSVGPRRTDRHWTGRLGLTRRHWLDVREPVTTWVTELRRFRPDCLMGVTGTLRMLARHLHDNGIHDIRPRVLVSTSEVLDAGTRRLLEETFATPARDVYASWEAGIVAWECPAGGHFHLNADWVIVEILDETGAPVAAGQEGQVVLTCLHADGMPVIRYAIGDRAVRGADGACRHSRLPLLGGVRGRQTDMLINREGRAVSAHLALTAVSLIPGIRAWRLIQESPEHLRLQVQADTPIDTAALGDLRLKLSTALGHPVDIQLEPVDAFPNQPGVKFRHVLSRVAPR